MCTPGDAATNAEGMGSLRAGNQEARVGLLGRLLDSFYPCRAYLA